MKTSKIVFSAFILATVIGYNSCSNQTRNKSENYDTTHIEAPVENIISSDKQRSQQSTTTSLSTNHTPEFFVSKAASPINDGEKKFIRTANLQLKVKDVISAVHKIEDIIIDKRGFIIESTINEDTRPSWGIPFSKDSVLIKKIHAPRAQLILRVDNTLLDISLRQIVSLTEEISYRTVKAEEVTFDIIAKQLEQERKKDKSKRMTDISNTDKGHKLEDLLKVEHSIDHAREKADLALVQEYKLGDQIKYSTIILSLSQEAKILTEVKPKSEDIKAYTPSFVDRFKSAFISGWNIFLEIVIFFTQIWPLILLIALIIYGVIIYQKRKLKKKL